MYYLTIKLVIKMNKEQLNKFKDFCYSFANRYKDCVCKDTPEHWLHTMSKFKYWRLLDELEFKYNIIVKESNKEYLKIYEGIFVEVLSKYIDEYKKIQSEKDKKAAKNKNVKRKKD